MSPSRRERAKREDTFLEQVRNWMQLLSKEIDEVKMTVSEMRMAQEVSGTYSFNTQDVDQLAYSNTSYNLNDSGYSRFEHAACPIAENEVLSYLQPSAPAVKHGMDYNQFNREQLLACRTIVESNGEPSELNRRAEFIHLVLLMLPILPEWASGNPQIPLANL